MLPLPLPGLATRTEPPWSSTRCLTILETKSQSAVVPGSRRISLAKPLENMGKKIRFNLFAGIRDVQLQMRVNSLQYDLHATAARSEFDRVGQQIPDDLLKAAGISGDRARIWINHGKRVAPLSPPPMVEPIGWPAQRRRPVRGDGRRVELSQP